ncbi:bifunctional riboflavin kinase/FAD synthetase [Leeia sp. TBRC 13508]|uniref:Riboflavin biosynthesis protein n=1 Tax=Leeia speluncae TaxID=2884804 RepID=A0ABS8D5S1_9NEIS|nr:bifunctional riboflavin kinase/FAD synthetase [Leeia speluncae]MCB6183565.1 bifunctional riboflavin kinase/FAD synthetase [Leeia speluncae]
MQVYRGLHSVHASPCAVTIGNFDGIHAGHQALLQRLKSEAQSRSLPTLVITFEPHPKEFFSSQTAPTRLTSLREKLELFREMGIDYVCIYPFRSALASISAEDFVVELLKKQLHTSYLLIGDDFCFGAKRKGNFALLQQFAENGLFELSSMTTFLQEESRVSSTRIRDSLESGRLEDATSMLLRPYRVSGKVVHGNKLGRTIGFPTANIHIKHNRPPLSGIFAVSVDGIDDKPIPGAASFGVRPTVMSNGLPTLEVFLLDFSGNLYGKHVGVRFHHKLRNEEKYPDLDSLVTQINKDVAQVKQYFVQHPNLLTTSALPLLSKVTR